MATTIHEMAPGDCEDLLSFWDGIEGVGLSESDTPEQLSAFLLQNRGLSLVVRDGDSLVGAVLCGHDGRRGYLHHLAVAPEYRGRGLGRSVVESCLAKLAQHGILKCNIFVYDDNDHGSAFWRRMGWFDRADLKVMQCLTPSCSDASGEGNSKTNSELDEGISIHRASPAEAKIIAPLFDAYRQFYGQESHIEAAEDFIKQRLDRDESVIFYTVKDTNACGFAQLYPAFSSVAMRPIWILNDLFVLPEIRKCGIGQRLLATATSFAGQSGAQRLTLATASDNRAAQSLYEKSDWKEDSAFVHYHYDCLASEERE